MIFRWIFWTITLALSGLIVVNTLPYYEFGLDHAFFLDKGRQALSALWRSAFYFHITGSLVCLLTGPLLLSRWALRTSPTLHRWLGWGYVLAALCWAVPGGLYLAIHARGGFWGQSGFLLLGIAWWGTTLAGLLAIRQRRMRAHLAWMTRSYALAASSISFRMFQVGLFLLDVPDHFNYVASLWLSFVTSVLSAEAVISRRNHGHETHSDTALHQHDPVRAALPVVAGR